MTSSRKTILRLVVAAMLAVPSIAISVSVSSAAPSKAEVEAAKAKLDDLNRQLDQLIEQYNQAQVRLELTQAKLLEAKQAEAGRGRHRRPCIAELSKRAVAAYTGMGSQLDVLLGAEDFTEFSDRLQFMGALAQDDADLAAEAQIAGQKSRWAAEQYGQALTERQATLDEIASHRSQIEAGIADQQALYSRLSTSYKNALAAQAARGGRRRRLLIGRLFGLGRTVGRFRSAAERERRPDRHRRGVLGDRHDLRLGLRGSERRVRLLRARLLGVRAGRHLPAAFVRDDVGDAAAPVVERAAARRPDVLLLAGQPRRDLPGGGSMIDASHPGPGGEVAVRSVYWDYFDWGGRIG